MKKLLLAAFAILSVFNAKAQIQTDSINGSISYKKIVEVRLKKDEIKKHTEKWLALKFINSKEVIELSNEDNIIGNGIFKENIVSGSYSIPTKFYFTFDIAFKEGRYKIEFYSLTMNNGSTTENLPVEYYPNLTKEKLLEIGLRQFKSIEDEKIREQSIVFYKKSIETKEAIETAKQFQEDFLALISKKLDTLSKDLERHLKKVIDNKGW